jgi:hypothetical protein
MLKICQGETNIEPIDIKPKTKTTSLFSCASDDAQVLVSKKTFFKSSSEINKANKGNLNDFEENNIIKDNSESDDDDDENDDTLNKISNVEKNNKIKNVSAKEDELIDMSKVNDNIFMLCYNSINI